MVKPLSFKGDKKPKKRKRTADPGVSDAGGPSELNRTTPPPQSAGDGEHDHSWVSADALTDLGGPIMLVLPSEPPTCLACDPNGKVFADEVVNIIDGNPSSAEPHDARQVWVVNKIVGTEQFRFKGRHGKFLSCDQYGILSATSEAVSPPETWNVIPTTDAAGTFQLQTQRETFLTTKESSKTDVAPSVRGDASDIGFDTTLRIRMQARFKPKLKASKEEKAKEKISRKALEEAAGRRLDEDEVRMLKKARREGDYHEQLLNLKQKSKHDKYG